MRIWLLFIFVNLCNFDPLKAQYIYTPTDGDTAAQSISTTGIFTSGSKGLTNQTIVKYLRKDFFSNSDKKEILNRTYPENVAGWEYHGGIQYQFRNNTALQYTIHVGISSVTSLGFNRESAQLLLNGNSYYAGKMMALDGLKYYNLNWQYIGIGIGGKYKKRFSWQTGLQFIYAKKYTHLQLNSGNLYTESNGEYINLRLNGNYINSDPVPYSNPGFAGQAAFSYNTKTGIKFGGGVRDLGLAFLNQHSTTASLDTTIHFEGLVLTGFNLPNQSKLEDSLKALPGQYIKTGAKTMFLPTLANIYAQGFYGKDQWAAGIDYRFKTFYLPAFWATYIKNLGRHSIQMGLTAGGYGIFGCNLGYRYSGRYTAINIQIRDLEGFIASKVFPGAGLYLNFARSW